MSICPGVATFCRVKSTFLSNEVALPISAQEGFSGLLTTSKGYEPRKEECPSIAEGLECFSRDELLKVDSEGRCLITDHGHFGEYVLSAKTTGMSNS